MSGDTMKLLTFAYPDRGVEDAEASLATRRLHASTNMGQGQTQSPAPAIQLPPASDCAGLSPTLRSSQRVAVHTSHVPAFGEFRPMTTRQRRSASPPTSAISRWNWT